MGECRVATTSHKEGWEITEVWVQTDRWRARVEPSTDGRTELHAHKKEQNKDVTFLWIYIIYAT